MNGKKAEAPEEYIYYMFASKFGWTPEQVDSQGASLIDIFIETIQMENEAQNKKLKKK